MQAPPVTIITTRPVVVKRAAAEVPHQILDKLLDLSDADSIIINEDNQLAKGFLQGILYAAGVQSPAKPIYDVAFGKGSSGIIVERRQVGSRRASSQEASDGHPAQELHP
jgi:hypothetical protein